MRTTLNIDDGLMHDAQQATRLPTKTAVVEAGLRLLVQRAAARRLAALRGTAPDAWAPERRRRVQGR